MAEFRVPARCDNCGQTDDHPKLNYAQQTYHHDCIPAFVVDDLTHETFYEIQNGALTMTHRVPLPEENIHPGNRRVLDVRKKAESGTRGAKLAQWIENLPPAEEVYGTDDGKDK